MSTPAGWYPQPDGQQRYWDGEQWTEDFEAGAGTPVTTAATGGQQARLRFKKKHVIGYTATALVALAIGAASAGGTNSRTNAGPASDTLPVPALTVTSTIPGPATTTTVPGPNVTKTVTQQAPAKTVTVTVTAEPPAAAQPAPGGSSCDKAREAILTGSPADINASMKALIADTTAPSIAREYARYYTGRDAGQKDMQEMDITLIQSACS